MPSVHYAALMYNMAMQHVEKRQFKFNSPHTGRLGSAYYHVFLPCVRMKWPAIDPGL